MDGEVKRRIVRADRAHLERTRGAGEIISEIEPPHGLPVRELAQSRAVAIHRAPKPRGELAGVAVVVTV